MHFTTIKNENKKLLGEKKLMGTLWRVAQSIRPAPIDQSLAHEKWGEQGAWVAQGPGWLRRLGGSGG